MSNTRMILATAVAALALSGLMSASASAAWVIDGTTLTGSAKLASTAAVTENFKLTLGELSIECTGSTLNGTSPQLEAPNKASQTTLILNKCATISGSNCKLPEQPTSLQTVPLMAEATLEGTLAASILLSPKTKTLFMTLKLEGEKCDISGVQDITGKAKSSTPLGQMEETAQEGIVNTSSGELKLGSSAITLKGKASGKLESGLPWHFA